MNLSTLASLAITVPPADRTVRHGHALQLGGLRFDIRHTPGHSPGGICMHQPENQVAFVGDTLFREGIGRYDFPTSDGAALLRAIRRQLFTLPDPTRILPGHGPPTTIAHEKQYNPFLM